MTLRFKWGEFGDVNPIRCIDSKGNEVNITLADPTTSEIHILSESKQKLLLTITDTDFTFATPNVNWIPTKVQSETMPPGNYQGEVHLKNTGSTINRVFEFPVFIEKAKGNIPP